MTVDMSEFELVLRLLDILKQRWQHEQVETDARLRAIIDYHDGHERDGLPCMTIRLARSSAATDGEAYAAIRALMPQGEVIPEDETKSQMYVRQSERAAADIATWPRWMQKNLKPPTVKVDVPVAVPVKDDGY